MAAKKTNAIIGPDEYIIVPCPDPQTDTPIPPMEEQADPTGVGHNAKGTASIAWGVAADQPANWTG